MYGIFLTCHIKGRRRFDMEKKKYYVNMQSREISQIPYHNNTAFTIHATKEEVSFLRQRLENVHKADASSFWRSHVPIMPYHHDEPNDNHDEAMSAAWQMIYDLGDETAQQFIEEHNLLTDGV